MTKVKSDISVSLDGYVAGPNPTLDEPLGVGGEQLHEWILKTRAWREAHGKEGGETGPDSDVAEELERGSTATVMGRKMFSGGEGPWEDDSRSTGWWGDEPPFRHPVFVLTHHQRDPLTLGDTTFNFVTDGIESAVAEAREAAGGGDVNVAGGGVAIQQAIAAGLLEEIQIHIVPVLLGGGARLFDNLGDSPPRLQQDRQLESPTGVAHLRYRIAS